MDDSVANRNIRVIFVIYAFSFFFEELVHFFLYFVHLSADNERVHRLAQVLLHERFERA